MIRSKSYGNFKKDLEGILSSIITLDFYKYASEALFVKRKNIKLDTEWDEKIFERIHSFEKLNHVYNSLFISLIAILETYLQDRLIEELKHNDEKINHLITKYSIERKLTVEDVIKGPRHIAIEIIQGTIFHKLPTVNTLYKIVFGADILSLLKEKKIFQLIEVRHKIVHHSSRVGDKTIIIREIGVLNAMNLISRWLENIEFYLNNKKERRSFPNYVNRYSNEIGKLWKSKIYAQSSESILARAMSKWLMFDKGDSKKEIHWM